MIFFSKKGFFISIIIFITIIGLIIGTVIDFNWFLFIITITTSLFLLWVYFGTYYVMKDDYLFIRSGPIRGKINIKDIKTVKKVTNLYSSAALSLDRLEIITEKKILNAWYISPKNEEIFLYELKKRNEYIFIE